MQQPSERERPVAAASDVAWYLAHTDLRRELMVAEALERKGFRAYLPMATKVIRPQNRRQVVARPLFPGYVFLGLDPERPAFSAARKTFGLQWIVTSADRYVQVPSRVVADIQALEIMGEWDETCPRTKAEPDLRPGDQVKVVGGALAEFAGEVLSVPSHQRVNILLARCGRRASVPLAQVQRIA